MLVKQIFPLSFAGGLDTKTDPKQIIPAKLSLLENGIFVTAKEIQKRNGNSKLNTSIQNSNSFTQNNTVPSNIINGNFLTSFNQELVLNDDANFYSFSDGIDKWVYKSPNTICELTTNPIIRNTYNQTLADSAISPAGLQIFAWEDSQTSSVHISVVDTNTNQIIINNLPLSSTSARPKCAYINNKLLVFYIDSAVNQEMYFVAYTNGSIGSPVLVASDVKISSTQNNYDIYPVSTAVYVTYYTSSSTIKITFITSTLGLGTTISKSESASNCISVFQDVDTNVWVAYASSTNVKAFIVNSNVTSTVTAPFNIQTLGSVYNITGIGAGGAAFIFYDVLGSADTNGNYSNAYITWSGVSEAGTVNITDVLIHSAALQSKAFLHSFNNISVPHVVITHDAFLQPTYFLCNLYNYNGTQPVFNIASKIAYGLGGGIPTKSQVSSVNMLSNGVMQTALLQKDLLFTSSSTSGTVNTYTQTGIISSIFNFNKTNPNTTVLGNNLHIGSGYLGMYDGASIVEHGFHLYPEAVTLTVNTSGGNLTDSSSYGYQILYEWTDNMGQLHRSSPSPVVSATTGSHSNHSQGVLTIPTLRITQKINVNIVVYRTQANGTVYYRLNLPTSPLVNSLTSDTVTYTDNASDASIASNEQIYTTGGEVVNIAAPASTIMSTYQNRGILVPSENPFSFWFSKQVIPGSPVEFSDFFVQNVSTVDGGIKAVMQMDSNLILFKENSIWYVSGQGPTPAGTNNDFTDALRIATDVGCVSSSSLVLMPAGIMFKSHKGIYLISRSLQVDYIGADVELYNDTEITSAQLFTSTNQILFTLDNNIALLFDYYYQQWSVFTNYNAISSTISDNLFTYLEPNGIVMQETPGIYTDNGQFIKLRLKTSWLSLAGLQGFQRIYKTLILGQYFGPHQLQVQFAYNFNPIAVQQDIINVTNLINSNIYGGDAVYGLNSPYGGSYPTYQWRVYNTQQTCESIQITLEDIPLTGTYINNQGQTVSINYNESMSLSGISLEFGLKKGAYKLPANRSSS